MDKQYTSAEVIDEAAQKLAEMFDYPWEAMPERGREDFRKKAKCMAELFAARLEQDERAVPEGWREVLQGMRDNAECYGQYSKDLADTVLYDAMNALGHLEEAAPAAPAAPHPDDAMVDNLAAAMKVKMAKQRAKGYGGWDDPSICSAEDLQRMLFEHIAKGDPVDVANFAGMLFARGERTALPAARGEDERDAARLDWLDKNWISLSEHGIPYGSDIRSTIDAAMAQKGGE